ncbi:MAG: hypothetical protein AB8B88_05330 [Devosiaceae bacterium]
MQSQRTDHKVEKVPHLVRFLIKNAAIGFVMAIPFMAAMLYFNIGNLMTIIGQSDAGMLALALLTVMIGLTFASLQMGFAVMFRSDDIGKGTPQRIDPDMSQEELQQLGLKPIPVRIRKD